MLQVPVDARDFRIYEFNAGITTTIGQKRIEFKRIEMELIRLTMSGFVPDVSRREVFLICSNSQLDILTGQVRVQLVACSSHSSRIPNAVEIIGSVMSPILKANAEFVSGVTVTDQISTLYVDTPLEGSPMLRASLAHANDGYVT
jgi:hypothetical protein